MTESAAAAASVIPAPLRLTPATGSFCFGGGATVSYGATALAPLAERFCEDVARRRGVHARAAPAGAGHAAPGIIVSLGSGAGLAGLPAALGADPTGTPADERYALTVGGDGVTLRAAQPAGAARGLASLLQLVATAPADAGGVRLPALRFLDAPRFVTLVPEVDTPGHAAALVRLRPELGSGRNLVSYELAPGQMYRSAWLDPRVPATFGVLGEVFAGLAGLFPGPFVHIGGDEPFGMPDDAYTTYVGRLIAAVRGVGKRTVSWQESIRAGADPRHLIQYWISAASPASAAEAALPPEAAAAVTANNERSHADIERALAIGVPVIASPQSHCYLDVPYAEASADPAQEERRHRVGLRFYPAQTLAATFGWDPAAALGPQAPPGSVAGVEAAVWCETVGDFGDLTFLLLPRLAGVAEKAWGAAGATSWPEHRAALARHGRLWDQDGLTFFRAATVDWC